MNRRIFVAGLVNCLAGFAGCGQDALVNLSAADALEAVSRQTRQALAEYDADLAAADDLRETAVIDAFAERLRRDHAVPGAADAHKRQFTAALARLRADRLVGMQRFSRAQENLREMDDVAAGLRRLALQSARLGDEWHRYVGKLIEARRRASQPATGAPASSPQPVAGPFSPAASRTATDRQ